MSEALLSQKQVSEIISLSKAYIYTMMKRGDFPRPKKYGHVVRWFKSDVEQWLKEQKEEHNKEQGIFTTIGKL